ncbi:coiled-coil domain-containing protein 180 [Candoia aspera]|uniref:coiled-coil domain-containing protein 180 n=1 Tax=Candoia aspera TaxID=51853 RepID=UPI002FD8692E
MCRSNKNSHVLPTTMPLVGVPRVLPSGKVYRQIFDDEINLVHALGEARNKITQHKALQLPGRIPLVRDMERRANNGFLSERQQMWIKAMPNDELTENPVQYKEAVALACLKAKESDCIIAAREVRGLADVIVSEKRNSNIIERISESKKLRYEEAVAKLRQELACVGKEMEMCYVNPGKLFLTRLSESDQAMESSFLASESNIRLVSFSIHDFERMWGLIFQETQKRRQWIRELDEMLHQAEVDRAERITAILNKYTKILEDIAYLLIPDVHRFIHKEAMMINQALLANRKAVSKLFLNLMEDSLKKDSFYRYQLEERKEIWKIVQKEYIISSFREFMESDSVQDPSGVKTELENMLEEQRSLAHKRVELLFSLGHLLPVKHTKAEINEWYESLVALNKRIDTHNVQSMMRIRLQYEKICQECLEKVQECKQKLVDLKICSLKDAEKIVNPNFYQLIGKLQAQFEVKIEKMDTDLEHLVKNTEINCRHLYQYFQDALNILDAHQQKLTQQENDLYKSLNDCRSKHENINKLREINLDILVDKLRMQSTDEKLKAYLEKVGVALDFIRNGYMVFRQELLCKIMAYPDHIRHELLSYSSHISRYFYVLGSYKGVCRKQKARPGLCAVMPPAQTSSAGPLRIGSATDTTGENEEIGTPESPPEQDSEEGLRLEEEEDAEEEDDTEQEESEQEEGEMEASAPESGRSSVPRDDRERSKEGNALGLETGDGGEPASAKDGGKPSQPKDVIVEFFTTSGGNAYKVVEHLKKSRARRPERYYAGKLKSSSLPFYVEQAYLSESFLRDVRRQIRLQFFEHLEKWFNQTLSSAWGVVGAKKEELNSELQLRLHFHEPRMERIEKDIYYVRIAELRLHRNRLIRHCAGLLEALKKERKAFVEIRENHSAISKSFRVRIQDMEKVFQMESRADKVVSLSQNLHTELLNHVEVLQVSMRSHRQYLEEALGKLRDSNMQFLKNCRLFSEGGNFSPEELEIFMKQLQKENGRIEFVEGLIMIDMEKTETSYLEQAVEIINKFENRFRFLAMDRVFLEKIQRFLTNIQVKIKTEVSKSNWQTQQLNSYLEKLAERIDACTHPNVDKECVTPEALYEFATFAMEELKKRCKYLNCQLKMPEPEISSLPLATIQDSLTSAAPSDISLPESKVTVMGMEYTPILNPSRMGKPAFDDASFYLIRNLIGLVRGKKMADAQHEKDLAGSLGGDRGEVSPSLAGALRRESFPVGQSNIPPKKSSSITKVSESGTSIQKYTRVTKADKKLQIFGDKPKETGSDHFNGIIFSILWDNFDNIMNVAEEFYKKDKHQVTKPDCLQETYDQCIEALGQKMLTYLLQSDEYHIACISEFRVQLKKFEEELPHVIRLAIGKLLKDHEQLLVESTEKIRGHLQDQLQKWTAVKDRNMAQLHTSLGHPDNIPVLEALCQKEEKRQEEQIKGILVCSNRLKVCVTECAQKFVSALATCTENILMELDNSLTIDDVQIGKTEKVREKTITLIRRKKAGLSLEVEERKLVAERGSRTWPGIPQTTIASLPNQIIFRETASVTTAKTTLGHMAAVQERDAVYVTGSFCISAHTEIQGNTPAGVCQDQGGELGSPHENPALGTLVEEVGAENQAAIFVNQLYLLSPGEGVLAFRRLCVAVLLRGVVLFTKPQPLGKSATGEGNLKAGAEGGGSEAASEAPLPACRWLSHVSSAFSAPSHAVPPRTHGSALLPPGASLRLLRRPIPILIRNRRWDRPLSAPPAPWTPGRWPGQAGRVRSPGEIDQPRLKLTSPVRDPPRSSPAAGEVHGAAGRASPEFRPEKASRKTGLLWAWPAAEQLRGGGALLASPARHLLSRPPPPPLLAALRPSGAPLPPAWIAPPGERGDGRPPPAAPLAFLRARLLRNNERGIMMLESQIQGERGDLVSELDAPQLEWKQLQESFSRPAFRNVALQVRSQDLLKGTPAGRNFQKRAAENSA